MQMFEDYECFCLHTSFKMCKMYRFVEYLPLNSQHQMTFNISIELLNLFSNQKFFFWKGHLCLPPPRKICTFFISLWTVSVLLLTTSIYGFRNQMKVSFCGPPPPLHALTPKIKERNSPREQDLGKERVVFYNQILLTPKLQVWKCIDRIYIMFSASQLSFWSFVYAIVKFLIRGNHAEVI